MDTVKAYITQTELDSIIASTGSEKLFDEALQLCARDTIRLTQLLALYVTFNAPFVSGAAALTGAISSRPDLFRDQCSSYLFADRSVEVARRVHDAIVDEFLDRTEGVSHRTLAQGFLALTTSFVGLNINDLGRTVSNNPILSGLVQNVLAGYGNGNTDADRILFGLGWHMGSEILADDEFGKLDHFLNLHHGSLVQYLKTTKIVVGEGECTGYFWVEIHTSVEKDHFALAAEAAEMAIKYYTGEGGSCYAKKEILKGFSAFAEVQKRMLELLASF